MNSKTKEVRGFYNFCIVALALLLASCGGGGGGDGAPADGGTPTYTVGGTVSGLLTQGLTLQINGRNSLPIFANGAFTFSTAIAAGGTYNVTVLTQPGPGGANIPTQTCTVANGTGTVSANVTNVAVNCVNPYTIGGTVSGLTGTGLVLQNNSGDNLPISANNSFTFSTALADGATYDVTVLLQPTGQTQTCTVINGIGTISGANVTGVTVICSTSDPGSSLALFAGDMGGLGSADGTGAVARFGRPSGVATDSAGNVYVADTGNNTIRKITPAGLVTTLAGAAARFTNPTSVATDSVGNVYVADADAFNSTIRKITPAGVVTTLAGPTTPIHSPSGIATDSAGNVYVADPVGVSQVSKITPAGVVTLLAPTAGFDRPSGIATDSADNVYVADTYNSTIRKITPAGVVTTLAGTAGVFGSTDATGAAASFNTPFGVATDSVGNVYVADTFNSTIRKITPAGVVTTLAGTAGQSGSLDGTGAAARFTNPTGVATDGAGNVYVADTDNNTIRKITPAGVVTTLAGTAGVFGSTDATGAAASFNTPFGVATDSVGNVYVADQFNHTIRKITPAGVVTTLAGTAGATGSVDATGAAASFNFPSGVATDSAGNVYVADQFNHTIRKITPAGVVTTLAGTAGQAGSLDATGAAASFNTPFGVATDSAGNVYVADYNNHTIRKITPAGVVTTLAGTAGATGSVDATGAAASFNRPSGVATDSAGNVYVADTSSHTIRKITPAGVVTTLAGTAGQAGSLDATGAAASFFFPAGVATDSAGNVYVADTSNHTIRKITPAGAVITVVGVAGQESFVPGALRGLLGAPKDVAIRGTSLYIVLYNGVAVVLNVP